MGALRRQDAKRQVLAHRGFAVTSDRGEQVLAAVAAAYDDPDPKRSSRRRLQRLVRREAMRLLRRELPPLVEAVVRRAFAERGRRGGR